MDTGFFCLSYCEYCCHNIGVQIFLQFYFCFLCCISRSKIYGSCENELLSYTALKHWKIKKTQDNIIRCKNTFENIGHSSDINTHYDLGIEEMYFKIQTDMTVQLSSVAQSCLTLCDTMDSSTRDLPVLHQLPEFTQTHVHWIHDAI